MIGWSRELGLVRGIERASDNCVAVIKSHLAGRDPAHLRRYRVINFVTDDEKSQQIILRRRTCINWLDKCLIQMAGAVPPLARTFLIRRPVQRLLRHLSRKSRRRGVQRNHFPGAVRQHKQVAAAQPPQIGRAILDGSFMLRGHERAQIGKIGEQLRQVGQRQFAFAMEVLISADGILQVSEDAFLYLGLHGAAHQQQAGPGKAGRDQQHGEQKLGPHPKFHRSPLPAIIFLAALGVNAQTYNPCRVLSGNESDWSDLSPVSAAA